MVLSSWDASVLLLLLMCFSFTFVGVDSSSRNLPPPENLTLSWDPKVHLFVNGRWNEPAGLDSDCKVNYSVAIYHEAKTCPPENYPKEKVVELRTEKLDFKRKIPGEAGICVGITTNPMACDQKYASIKIYKNLSSPLALVKNFNCSYYDLNKMNCTWTIVNNTPNLQLFYRIENNNEDTLKHCVSYVMDGTRRTGCHLYDKELTVFRKVSIFVISGTGENLTNKFTVDIWRSVKPPKPQVNITQEDGNLNFQASTPNFIPSHCLMYSFNYSKCNEKSKEVRVPQGTHVTYDTACRYTVQAKVIYISTCGPDEDIVSDMSEPVYYGEDSDPNLAFKVAMIIIPLILCFCLVAAIVLFRRYKDIILPKVPDPSLFFKDMLSTSDGLSKSLGGGKLYVPVKEDVALGISLEPKPLILHPNHDTCI